MSVLNDNTDLTGITGLVVRRGGDATSVVTYPCVVVTATEASHEAWAQRSGVDRIIVDVSAHTHRAEDLSGSVVNNMAGAIRDTFRDASLEDDLSTAVDGFHCYGVQLDQPGFRGLAGDPVRDITISPILHCVMTNVYLTSSSSSSSST